MSNAEEQPSCVHLCVFVFVCTEISMKRTTMQASVF